ncbi:MAG: DUF2332 domain-containing protein [Solirubrobacterales bacterium]|nr:DUF2332 domain-containing protein [Solirubrobacterales bacterium]
MADAPEPDVRAQIATRYRRFAHFGAARRSPVYERITNAIAQDAQILDWLAEMPESKQQPNLLLGAVRFLYGTPEDPHAFLSLVHERWDEVAALMRVRSTQTNEPARCATLLPVLARLPQPMALLEVGASAGLCLLPDRYAYEYDRAVIEPSMPSRAVAPRFSCRASARTPLPRRNVEVAWRAGLDRRPLNLSSDDDVRWLEALVWPGEEYRIPRLRAAIEVARAHPPRLVVGDLRTDVKRLAAEAPADVTLVVYHTAVLAYVGEAEQRAAFARSVAEIGGVWVANEGIESIPGAPRQPFGKPAREDAFLLWVDGEPVAWTDSHGTWIDWQAR